MSDSDAGKRAGIERVDAGEAGVGRLHAALGARLRAIGPLAVAVSGGVDSMTLAVVAHRVLDTPPEMLHAVSPAVPAAASARVRRYADAEGWRLRVIDAGEFADSDYRANPVNRCFFCKQNLYSTMRALSALPLASGTNRDDLGDYRPGLQAAAGYGVLHPYVDAGIDKAGVRALARRLGLSDLAELPAAPCLSSRVETGIRIEPAMLAAIDAVETLLRERLRPQTARCRLRGDALAVELDAAALAALNADAATRTALSAQIRARFAGVTGAADKPLRFERYRMGSAFLRERAS